MTSFRIPLVVLLCAPVGCADLGDDGVGEVLQGATVTWTNLVGVTATGNSLAKSATQATWGAGASSVATISGDGYAEFSTDEATTAKMAGLSNGDASASWQEIDYAIYLKADGHVSVRENGVAKGALSTYLAGDVFRIEVASNVVTYAKNGTVFYTSAVAPTYPLGVDTSFLTPNGTIADAVLVSTALHWQNAVNVTVDGNNLTKTGARRWNAGAASTETITGAGFVEFTTGEANKAKMAGLSNGDTDQTPGDIDFAIHLKWDGAVKIYEGGVIRNKNFGTYVAGDVFRVEANGATVTYAKNGTVFYTSTLAPTYPLNVDTSLLEPGATISNVVLQ